MSRTYLWNDTQFTTWSGYFNLKSGKITEGKPPKNMLVVKLANETYIAGKAKLIEAFLKLNKLEAPLPHKKEIVDKISRFTVKYAVENGWSGCCLLVSILFHEELKKHSIESKIVEGFLHDAAISYRHYVVRVDDEIIDLMKEINLKVKQDGFDRGHQQFNEKVLPGFLRNDDEENDGEMEMFYKAYKESPEEFWNIYLDNCPSHNLKYAIESYKTQQK